MTVLLIKLLQGNLILLLFDLIIHWMSYLLSFHKSTKQLEVFVFSNEMCRSKVESLNSSNRGQISVHRVHSITALINHFTDGYNFEQGEKRIKTC